MRSLTRAFLFASSALLLGACDFKNDDVSFQGTPSGQFVALFDPSASVIPFPNNVLFSGTTDGTLNIPVADPADLSDPQVALNALDGFSTIAPMRTTFNQPIDPATVAASVRVFTATLDPATLVVLAITGELTYGMDFFAAVASTDPTGKTLSVVPLRPLQDNAGYVVGIKTSLRATDGQTVSSDRIYDATRIRGPLVDGNGNSKFAAFTDAQAAALEPLRVATNLQDDALNSFPAPNSGLADEFALAWAFKTQSIGVVLAGANGVQTIVNADVDVANAIVPVAIGSTADLLPAPLPPTAGFADIYVGTLTVPYFLSAPTMASPTAPLTSVWKGPTGLDVTGVIPGMTNVPAKTGNQTIPLLISVPNSDDCPTAPACPPRPNGGADPWPVVIYQHGITTSRSTLLAVADALAAAGFAAVAIDLPLHGLAPDSTLRQGAEAALAGAMIPLPTERTFDVDYVTQDAAGSIIAQVPDSVTDTSGRHFINLSSLLTSRDNLRQAVADLMTLYSQIDDMDYDGNAGNNPDFNSATARVVGWSLGAMVSSVFLALEPTAGAAVLAMPGGGIAKLLDGSPAFGPEIEAGLAAAAGLTKGSADYESFLGAAQTVVDSADPLNYAGPDATTGGTPGGFGGTTLNATRGVMLFEVVGDGVTNLPDQTIPNNVGTFALGFTDAPAGTVPSPTAGTDPLHIEMGLNQVTATALTAGMSASAEPWPLLRFTAGYHGSIADPSSDPAANATVTTVMQGAMATHVTSNGTGFDVDPQNAGVPFATVVEDPAP